MWKKRHGILKDGGINHARIQGKKKEIEPFFNDEKWDKVSGIVSTKATYKTWNC